MLDLFRAFRGAPERKSGPKFGGGGLLALSLGGAARWGGRDTAALARTGVMQNAVAYACIRKIASAAASVPWLLYDGAAELEDHPLLTLLARPNAREDGPSLFERWYAFLQSAGNAYLEAVALDGTPRELHVLRPDRVTVVPGARGYVRRPRWNNRVVVQKRSVWRRKGRGRSRAGRNVRASRADSGGLPIGAHSPARRHQSRNRGR